MSSSKAETSGEHATQHDEAVVESSSSLSTRSIGRSAGRRAVRMQSFENPLASPEKPPSAALPSSTPAASTSPSQYAVYSPAKRRTALSTTASEQSPSSDPTSSTSSHTPPPQFSTAAAATSIPPLISRPSNSTLPYTPPPPRHPASVRGGRPNARSVSEAQEMLLGQALKAELQTLLGGVHGNASESWGSAMATAVGTADETVSAGEWTDVLGALRTGKFTLLLPAEKMPAGSSVTPAFVREHLAIFEDEDDNGPLSPASENARGFATLGGLRGVLTWSKLIFGSNVEVMLTAKAGSALDYLDPEVRRQTLGSASVYPSSDILTSSDSTVFPFIEVLSPFTTLSVPRSSRASVAHFAALSRQSTGSRLAALFAKQSAAAPVHSDSDLPPVVQAPDGVLDSISSTEESGDLSASGKPGNRNLELRILAVARAVQRPTVSAAITKSLQLYIRERLSSIVEAEVSVGLIEGIGAYISRFPVPGAPSTGMSNTSSKSARGWDSVEEAADGWMDLTEALRPALAQTLECDTEAPAVNGLLDRIEGIVMEALYDRVFASPMSSDGADDDLLRRRIDMLRELGVGLEHLGVDMEGESSAAWDNERLPMREALENVANSVGAELSKLGRRDNRTPQSKLAVFVNMHKIIVEQLSSLPPIPLKKEIGQTGQAGNEPRPTEVEMDDASLSTGTSSKASSRPLSPTQEAEEEANLLKTPRPPIDIDTAVPDMALPNPELMLSVHEATSSSMFDRHSSARPSPTPSVFDSSRGTSRRASAAPSPSPSSSSSSADLILPILINAVITHRPTIPLVSHLRYALRFRAESLLRGETSYCATNLSAVLEFLQTVDLPSLGLGQVDGMTNYALPTATPLRSPSTTRPNSIASGRTSISFIVRRPQSVHDIDQFVDSANHALVRAADLLFGPKGLAPKTIEDVRNVLDGAGSVASKARGSILRRATLSGGSGTVGTANENADANTVHKREDSVADAPTTSAPAQREMVGFVAGSSDGFDSGVTAEYAAETEPTNATAEVEDPIKPVVEEDTRSVRSISSLIRDSTLVGKISGHMPGGSDDSHRQSLGGRLANIPGLSRFSGESKATGGASSAPAPGSGMVPSSSRTSLFAAFSGGSPTSSRRNTVNASAAPATLPTSPSSGMLSFFSGGSGGGGGGAAVPSTVMGHADGYSMEETEAATALRPSARFLSAQVDDLKLCEVAELLDEYKKVARALETLQQREGQDAASLAEREVTRVPDTTVAVQTE